MGEARDVAAKRTGHAWGTLVIIDEELLQDSFENDTTLFVCEYDYGNIAKNGYMMYGSI